VWSAKIPDNWVRKREEVTSDAYRAVVARAEVLPGCQALEGKHLGFYTEFPTHQGEQVLLKVGISLASIEGARENLKHDIPGWDFARCEAANRQRWQSVLSKVAIEGGSPAQQTAFATAMYHAFIDPRAVADVDGAYLGPDKAIHRNAPFTFRTVFSGWDVYRSEIPLLTILRPDIVNDEINSLMQVAQSSPRGVLPRWEFMGVESGCMIGDPAISVIAEAWRAGIQGFDVDRAYALCRDTAVGPQSARQDVAFYDSHGWVPGSISWTLENAYFDHCLAEFAAALNKPDDAALFAARAKLPDDLRSGGRQHACSRAERRLDAVEGIDRSRARLCRKQSAPTRLVRAARRAGICPLDGRGSLFPASRGAV